MCLWLVDESSDLKRRRPVWCWWACASFRASEWAMVLFTERPAWVQDSSLGYRALENLTPSESVCACVCVCTGPTSQDAWHGVHGRHADCAHQSKRHKAIWTAIKSTNWIKTQIKPPAWVVCNCKWHEPSIPLA